MEIYEDISRKSHYFIIFEFIFLTELLIANIKLLNKLIIYLLKTHIKMDAL